MQSHVIILTLFFLSRVGIGMDASITPLRHSGLSLVQTTDFFYPLVEDPYMQVSQIQVSVINMDVLPI